MANLSGLLVRMGDEKDAAEAWRWLTYAAEHGYPVAMNGMGELALAGRWCTQDDREAERWFCKAVDHGNANAMVNLGSMHERGAGGATAAAQLYRRAADLGNADAMVKLGALYLRGAGVDQDFSEATRLFVKAAELGHAGAQAKLAEGRRSLDGLQVPLPAGHFDFITCPQCNTRVRKSNAERALESNPQLQIDPFATALACPNCHCEFRTDKLLRGEYDSKKPARGYGFWILCGAVVLAIVAYNLSH
jgi:TPR repeat protein